MKSKFGFIPIVLPVLVMVLIIGAINLGKDPGVHAQNLQGKTMEMPTSTIGLGLSVDFTALGADGTALPPADGGIQADGSDGALTGDNLQINFGLASSSQLGHTVPFEIVVGSSASKDLRIGYQHTDDAIVEFGGTRDYNAESARLSYRVVGSGNSGFTLVPDNAGSPGTGGNDFGLKFGDNLIEFELLYEYTEDVDGTPTQKYWVSRHRVNVVLPADQADAPLAFKQTGTVDGKWYRYEEGWQIYRFYPAESGLIELPQATGGSGQYVYKLLDISDDDTGEARLPDGMTIYDSSSLRVSRATTPLADPALPKQLPRDADFAALALAIDNDSANAVADGTIISGTGGATYSATNSFPLQLGGRPMMASANDIDYYFLRYEVADATDTSTKIMIEFNVEVHRRPLQPGVDQVRPAAAPYAILASYTLLGDQCVPNLEGVGYSDPDLAMRYNPGINEYEVMVPTAIDTLHLRVAVDSDATVRMNRVRAGAAYIVDFTAGDALFAPNITATDGANATVGGLIKDMLLAAYDNAGIEHRNTDNVHLWDGDLAPAGRRGSVSEFVFHVVEGDEENTYTVKVRRRADTPAMFSNAESDPLVYRFFQGADVEETLPMAANANGNGATSKWRYTIYRTTDDEDVTEAQKAVFVGLTLASNTRVLSGMPNIGGTETSTPHKSSAVGEYIAHDDDCNRETTSNSGAGLRKDSDELGLEVHVYRNAAIEDFKHSVDGSPGATRVIDKQGEAYRYRPSGNEYVSRTYSYMATGNDMAIEEYQYDVAVAAASGTSTAVDLELTVDAGATVNVNGVRAEGTGTGRSANVKLDVGDNPTTVSIRNGQVRATHMLNLRLSGPSVSSIMVKADGMNLLAGDNAYDMFKFSGYEVSTFHPYVTVETDALDQYPGAAVSINGIAEDDLETVGLDEGRNTITVTVTSGGMSQTYTIVVIREADEAPTFETQPSDLRLQVGKEVPASLGKLPMATGGNGMHSYTLSGLPSGLMLATSTDGDMMTYMISGTPDAPGPYEKDFTATWKAEDEDDNMVDDDAVAMFTITVTNAEVDYSTGPTEPVATIGSDDLRSLQVSYMSPGGERMPATLSPAFEFGITEYRVEVPDIYDTVYVTAIREADDAKISLGNTVLKGDLDNYAFSSTTLAARSNMIVIMVDPAGADMASQDYTITVSTASDSPVSFGSADIADATFPTGVMVDETLPEVATGNMPITYTLTDHNGDAVGAGLTFDGATRMLSGMPMLDDGSTKAVYVMTYMAVDNNGDDAEIEFNLTVCEAGTAGCAGSGGPTPPAPMMTEMLTETRSDDMMMATLTWTPDMMNGEAAAHQYVFSVAKNAGAPMDGLAGLDTATFMYEPILAGDAYMVELDGLIAGRDYVYGVIALFGGPPGRWLWGEWEIINYTP